MTPQQSLEHAISRTQGARMMVAETEASHWKEDVKYWRLVVSARALSDHLAHYGRIVTDATYGAEADKARQIMQDLRDALA